MNQSQIDKMITAFETRLYLHSLSPIQRATFTNTVEFLIESGFLAEVEQKNPYTFGGVTVALTDTELAMFMRLLSDGSKIQAIKMLRIDVSDKGLTLREAKDFADHLDSILSKSRS